MFGTKKWLYFPLLSFCLGFSVSTAHANHDLGGDHRRVQFEDSEEDPKLTTFVQELIRHDLVPAGTFFSSGEQMVGYLLLNGLITPVGACSDENLTLEDSATIEARGCGSSTTGGVGGIKATWWTCCPQGSTLPCEKKLQSICLGDTCWDSQGQYPA